ncbi:hypothetical protein [Bacillus paranthracis]|uniref:hypothetical protein n=1 Tax=Bacillus paranthracis TaxID=2026186 RepID=UPI000A301DC5|nr:hypothetical protein [Bacillus paranthracis]MCU5288463.1 hypothetical protein [Bacillus paranthracis]SME52482.1 hypothetical protein BACERE00176_05510 [Bacillus paranthracis]
MCTPIIVLIEYDFYNDETGSDVSLFEDINNAIIFAKRQVEIYLEGNNLTVEDFQGQFDTLDIIETNDSYFFNSWNDKNYDKFNIAVYKQEFKDKTPELTNY